MSFYFGMYLTSRQTNQEINNNQTIEDNSIGWNKPDSYMTPIFILLIDEYNKTGTLKITNDLIDFHIKRLSKALKKYKRQYDSFIEEKPFKVPQTVTQSSLF
jgi:hypothetical protein